MNLQSSNLYLREVSLNDVTAIHNLNSFPEVDQYNTLGIPESVEQSRKLVETLIAAQAELPRQKYAFVVELAGSEFVGLMGLVMGKEKYRTAELWYKIHPNFWGQGLATEGVRALLQFGFVELQLHRITAGCAVENLASIRVLEKVGMQREGHCREILPIRGLWVDNYEYALLERDYFAGKG